jgi:hypothetical protein
VAAAVAAAAVVAAAAAVVAAAAAAVANPKPFFAWLAARYAVVGVFRLTPPNGTRR